MRMSRIGRVAEPLERVLYLLVVGVSEPLLVRGLRSRAGDLVEPLQHKHSLNNTKHMQSENIKSIKCEIDST